MPAVPFAIDPLLEALSEDAPCGPELDFDPDYLELERAGQGVPERQYGDKIFAAEPPDWQRVYELALGLARRTRDLRLAVWLTRAGARLQGIGGALLGLQLCQGLLQRHWACVHPQLDAGDNDDPTMRLNALAPLSANDAVLADLRAAGLTAARGTLTLRELELGLGLDDPHRDEVRPTEAGVLQGLATVLRDEPGLADTLNAASAAAQAIAAAIDGRVDTAAPNLLPLLRLLALGPQALGRLAPSQPAQATAGGAPAAAARGSVEIGTRADAARELERICTWLERNEPGHPAPLLLRRAQRLMNMTFIEIIQDMAPAGIDQVQAIAGTPQG